MKSTDDLDKYDLQILHVLQRSGRMSIVDLARQVNLSKTPCLNRVRRLEREGFISGYEARLNPDKIRQGHLVYVQVKLNDTTSVTLNSFNKAVQSVPQILSCHMLSGGFDYLLKIRTRDMPSYRQLLGDIIADLPGVSQTSTFPVMEKVKETTYLAIPGIDIS